MSQERIESFLGRWSRLKHAERTGETDLTAPEAEAADKAQAPEAGLPQNAESGVGNQTEGDEAEQQNPAARDYANFDYDSLRYESDYEQFMEANVPDDVRTTALRKLWVSNPVLANMDGLDDYCEDYTDAAVCLPKGVMKTAYRFGRGFLSDDEVAEWEALGKPAQDSEVAAADSETTAAAEDQAGMSESDAGSQDWSETAATSGAGCAAALKAEEAAAEVADAADEDTIAAEGTASSAPKKA